METDNKSVNKSDSNKVDDKSNKADAKKKKDKISEKAVILILSSLVFILIFYIIASRFIELRNNKLSEEYLNITTEQITEADTVSDLLININSDDIFELTQLNGIGKAKAEAIINYRKENGDFITIDEIKNVPGIGEAIFESIKDKVYIETSDKS